MDTDTEVIIPDSHIVGRIPNSHAKHFVATIVDGVMRVDCHECPEFWLRIDLNGIKPS